MTIISKQKVKIKSKISERKSADCVHTLKNSFVEPESSVPYAISVCLAKSSALSIGETIRSTVRKAARLAVQEEMMIRVKNHHTPPTIRPDRDLKRVVRIGSYEYESEKGRRGRTKSEYRDQVCKRQDLIENRRK